MFLSRYLPHHARVQEWVAMYVVMTRDTHMKYVIQVMIQLREAAVRQYMMHIQPLVLPAAELAFTAVSLVQWLND